MKRIIILFVVLGSICLNGFAWGAPIPFMPSLSVNGNGLNSVWVDTSFPIASLATAENALLLSTGDPGYIDKINYVIPHIDMGDNNPAHYCSWGCDGKIPGYIPVPYDDTFAGRIFGYLNITTEENYTFNVMIDDGFRLTIGGDVISFFDGLTSITDVNRTIHLTPGLYEFEMVTYENEGGFWNELTWKTPTTSYALIPQDVFFTHVASVPEPSTLLLFGSGLAGIIALRRKLSL